MDSRKVAQDRGFTLIEVSIILLTLVILSSIMLPQMGVFLRDARFARAREDVAAIGVAMIDIVGVERVVACIKVRRGNVRGDVLIAPADSPLGTIRCKMRHRHAHGAAERHSHVSRTPPAQGETDHTSKGATRSCVLSGLPAIAARRGV